MYVCTKFHVSSLSSSLITSAKLKATEKFRKTAMLSFGVKTNTTLTKSNIFIYNLL